jgi:hypothetical protein
MAWKNGPNEKFWILDFGFGAAQRDPIVFPKSNIYTAVELRTGVFAGEETPVLNQSEV